MTYLPPFARLKERVAISGANGKGRVALSYAEFTSLIKQLLYGVAVDEAWYLGQYPDVAEAVRNGAYRSARHHFIEEGYFEGRRPCEFEVDEAWYIGHYADVAAGVKAGTIASAKEHFRNHGYQEGRRPAEY